MTKKKKVVKVEKVKCSVILTKSVHEKIVEAALADRRSFSAEVDMRLETTIK